MIGPGSKPHFHVGKIKPLGSGAGCGPMGGLKSSENKTSILSVSKSNTKENRLRTRVYLHKCECNCGNEGGEAETSKLGRVAKPLRQPECLSSSIHTPQPLDFQVGLDYL